MRNLSGGWTGTLSTLGGEDTAFTAVLEEVAGIVSGRIEEASDVGGLTMRAIAQVRGSREGAEVAFAKTFEGQEAADYRGTLSGDGVRIAGFWQAGARSGGFEMIRVVEDQMGELVVERAAAGDFSRMMGR